MSTPCAPQQGCKQVSCTFEQHILQQHHMHTCCCDAHSRRHVFSWVDASDGATKACFESDQQQMHTACDCMLACELFFFQMEFLTAVAHMAVTCCWDSHAVTTLSMMFAVHAAAAMKHYFAETVSLLTSHSNHIEQRKGSAG